MTAPPSLSPDEQWQALRLIAAHLAPLFAQTTDAKLAPLTEREIGPASLERVSPALGWCITGRTIEPCPVADYFIASFELNTQRNAAMLAALDLALETLADSTPVLLKGAAALAQGLYPAAGARVMGDLDLLVPKERLHEAFTALQEVGFEREAEVRLPSGHHHLPMLVHGATGVGIEFHHAPLPPFAARLFDAQNIFANARTVQWNGRAALVPSPDMMIAMLVAHSQIVDGHDLRGGVPLRTLVELRLLCDRFGDALDWCALERMFGRTGHAAVLVRTCAAADALLGNCTPYAARASKAEAWLRRGLARSALRKWAEALRYRCRELPHLLRAEPHRLLRGLRPAKLREILRHPSTTGP